MEGKLGIDKELRLMKSTLEEVREVIDGMKNYWQGDIAEQARIEFLAITDEYLECVSELAAECVK